MTACANKPPTPAAPPPAPFALELGEITLFEGPDAMLKVHADGTTELGGRSGRMQITPGQTASSDSLPITWKPGPTLHADGSITAAGAAVAKVNADGSIVELKTNTTLPFTITADKVTFASEGTTLSVELSADGKLSRVGAPAEPANKQIRVEGADTAGKRRAMLVMVGVMLAPGTAHTTVTGSSVETVPVPPMQDQ
ncbi:MAG TPA: hypothetical protein VGO00_05135 [Kofleriaceae bacterium]|nr:hypothetical protein [Kofleriaceae bacterium]